MIKLTSLRKDPLVAAIPGGLTVGARLVVEALAAGRVTSLSPRRDLSLRPGVIYRAHTGIAFADRKLSQVHTVVRATPAMWRFGVRVERFDVGEGGELTICFSTVEPFPLEAQENSAVGFEVHLEQSLETDTLLEIADGSQLAEPGLRLAIETPSKHRHIVAPPALPANQGQKKAELTPEQEAAKVNDWLNSPDTKGAVVAQAAPQAATAIVPPVSTLSKGLSTALEGV